MMKRRIISIILALAICLALLPTTALAALLDNGPDYNQEILAQLTEICGSKDEAARYYAMLQQYGLLDEDGSVIDNWTIYYNGEEVTLAQIKELLADPDCDFSKYVVVDGTIITLGELKTILEIEEYIAYLRGKYFTDYQLTREQLDNLQSLIDQINSEGIMLITGDADSTPWPSGIDHEARVKVAFDRISPDTGTSSCANFIVTLTDAMPGQKVSFYYAAQPGSQLTPPDVSRVDLTAGDDGTITSNFQVQLPQMSSTGSFDLDPVRSTADLVYYVNLFDIQGALFKDEDGNAYDAMSLKCTNTPTLAEKEMPGGSFNYELTKSPTSAPIVFDGELRSGLDWGIYNKVEVDDGFNGFENPEKMYWRDGEKWMLRDVYWRVVFPSGIELQQEYLAKFDMSTITQETPTIKVENADHTEGYIQSKDNLKPGDIVRINSAVNLSYIMSYHWNGSSWSPETWKHEFSGLTLKFSDTQNPTVEKITAPKGTYYPGLVVSVKMTFSEPVKANGAYAVINEKKIYASESSGRSNVLTFPYKVQEADVAELTGASITCVYAEDAAGNHLAENYNPNEDDRVDIKLNDVKLSTPVKSHAITGVAARVDNAVTAPTMAISVSVLDNDKVNSWLLNDMTLAGDVFQTNSLMAVIDGDKNNLIPLTMPENAKVKDGLTASVSIPLNTGSETVTHMVELALDGEILISKYATAKQAAAKFVTADDLSVSLAVKQSDGVTDYVYADDTKTIYAQDDPRITASYALTGSGYSFGGSDQFEWSSSDPGVANIDSKTGIVTPAGPGKVHFTLTALNGGIEGKAVSVDTEDLTFGVGLTPFLLIPNNKLESVSDRNVTVFWSSNICNKNGETPTTFTVTVTKGDDPTPVYTTTISGTASAPSASVTIPGSALQYTYGGASGSNIYHVEVTTVFSDEKYTATAAITLSAKPAVVTLDKLETYYITDETSTVNIGWSIQNLDHYSSNENSDELFELLITRGNQTVYKNTDDPGTKTDAKGSGSYIGSYSLPIDDVVATGSPSSYRDVYTVTIRAKNGSDSTWSGDSFLLYVYDADALKILVNGKTSAGSVTMSNIAEISRMTQDQILALKRDVYLKNIISVNYGEYAWNEVSDQIVWASSDSGVASVNYQQGALYENIENFSYVSYRPTVELGLSGIVDGKALVTAVHKLTGMKRKLDVTVETLKDRLYLFQCYPQAVTELTYTAGDGEEKTVYTDSTGAAAVYEENGIQSNVYCSARIDGVTYLGTFYLDRLKTGEGDWTKLERYPLNNLALRRAAYAYLYIKNPDGTPYTGVITFRGGVYVDGKYRQDAEFGLNSSVVDRAGNVDQNVKLGADGKLTVVMDQTQWGLPGAELSARDNVQYIFEISQGTDALESKYYPMLVTVDATLNLDAIVGSGEAIVNFRANPIAESGKHPFIIEQYLEYADNGISSSVLDRTGKIGPSDDFPEAVLTTTVMWWGEDSEGLTPSIQLYTDSNVAISNIKNGCETSHEFYPFADALITRYSVKLNEASLEGVLEPAGVTGMHLNYYKDGETLSRSEELSLQLVNLLGEGSVEEKGDSIDSLLHNMGKAIGTNPDTSKATILDEFVGRALQMVASEDYSTEDESLFYIQLAPTSDPDKFLGLIQVNLGNMPEKEVIRGIETNKTIFDHTPGVLELLYLTGHDSFDKYMIAPVRDSIIGKAVEDYNYNLRGYMESLIYYDFIDKSWKIQVLDGGFNVGGGVNWTWNYNTFVGPVPLTASVKLGGTAEVSMDAQAVSYYNKNTGVSGLGNDFLTELRIFLYLRFFAGVGIDYAVVALKAGVFGQVSMDMRFQWLNRPYMDGNSIVNVADGRSEEKLHGEKLTFAGQAGLEFVARFLFINYEKILVSASYNYELPFDNWNDIQKSWDANKAALQEGISGLLNTNSLSVANIGGQQMLSLNLAPTLESRDYLSDGQYWGSNAGMIALDGDSTLKNLGYNLYPFANPMVADDGQIMVYLSDQSSSEVEKTHVAYATMGDDGHYSEGSVFGDIPGEESYGDSQVSLAGAGSFAAAAWTRHMRTVNKDAGSVLTDEDQQIIVNSSEIYAGIYEDDSWTTVRLTNNSSADLAPVAATNGQTAIVAWRAVAASASGKTAGGYADITTFDEKDTILYSIYKDGTWGDPRTLYNGTSGVVKGIAAAMLEDGTAAVAYTLDSDSSDDTLTDREIYYAIVDTAGNVTRAVRATNDAYLDENPQLTTVRFPGDAGHEKRFVLGWYTEHDVSRDAADLLKRSAQSQNGVTVTGTPGKAKVSDIRLIEFNSDGVTEQFLPDSISQAATEYGVSVSSNFRFTKNADSINDMSIIWVERAESVSDGVEVEKDVLKAVKFYTHDTDKKLVTFTGVMDVAEMSDGTLIDHFNAYVSDPSKNEIKAVILGSTYGANGKTETRTGVTVGGQSVEYTVPKRTTSIYTATETFTDKLEVPAVLAEYDTVRKGSVTSIRFTIKNNGIHAIEQLEIKVGDMVTAYSGLKLLPGDMIQLYADYTVPTDDVVNPPYIVTASFSSMGATGSANEEATAAGIIYLDRPDVEITNARILAEENGERTIQIKLNNNSDAALAKAGRYVKIGFYTDATCENPIEVLTPVIVSDPAELKILDEGGYSVQTVFNVKDYLPTLTGEDDPLTEIPENGISVYIKAEILEKTEDQETDDILQEPISSNNYASVTCENLKVRTGKDVSITSDFAADGSGSTVTVYLQNNRLSETTTGNIIATLLDENKNVLEQVQSYTGKEPNNGLITLASEEREKLKFRFSQPGVSVRISYTDVILETGNAELDSLNFSNIPGLTLDDFTGDSELSGGYSASVTVNDLHSTGMTFQPKSPKAKVTVELDRKVIEAEESSPFGRNITSLIPGKTHTVTITVTDGSETRIYTLTIQDRDTTPPSFAVNVAKTKHGTVMASPASASSGTTVTITATPDICYKLSQLHVIDSGGSELEVKDNGDGTYAITMPDGPVTVMTEFAFACDGGASCPSRAFADLDTGAWYHEYVDYVIAHRLMEGIGGGTFAPNSSITRAAVTTILWRLEGCPVVNYLMSFDDVADGSWYTEAVRWATSEKIVEGKGNRLFGTYDPIRREELAVILYRYERYLGGGFAGDWMFRLDYTDAADISDWAYEAVCWTTMNGIIEGNGNNKFEPKGTVTRTEAAAILMRFCENIDYDRHTPMMPMLITTGAHVNEVLDPGADREAIHRRGGAGQIFRPDGNADLLPDGEAFALGDHLSIRNLHGQILPIRRPPPWPDRTGG